MFATFPALRKSAFRLFALLCVFVVASCGMTPIAGGGGDAKIDPSRPVPVALLVPGDSAKATDNALAKDLEDAARMAVADLGQVRIDLRVYNTSGSPEMAAAVARQAVAEGARIIVGPLYSQSSNAAAVAVAADGVNVLSFSNTSTIAGGNLFVMGNLFETTADRLAYHAVQQGITRFYIVRADTLQGELGAAAATRAIAAAGGQIVGTKSYPLSQQGVLTASTDIAAQAQAAGAQAIIATANVGTELQILGSALQTAGLDPTQIPIIGLTRWDTRSEHVAAPMLQNGMFAVPDRARLRAFESRFSGTYGRDPLPVAGLSYDAIAAIGALIATGDRSALSAASLTRPVGFQGTAGIFRLRPGGLNQRGLAVAQIVGGNVQIVSPAPRSFSNGVN